MSVRRVAAAAVLLLLSACSERVIASSGEVLVVVEDIKAASPNSKATVHYVLSTPQPLSNETGAPLVSRMRYEAEVDCAGGAWGHRVMETTLADGQVIADRPSRLQLVQPTPDTLGASVVSSVCDPAVRSANTVSRSLKSIERENLRQMARR